MADPTGEVSNEASSARRWMADCRTAATYRLIHLVGRFLRPMTLGARVIVLDDANRVFLIRHTYVPGWHLPGGGVEAGETTLAAMHRELREEANLAAIGTPQIHGIFFNARYSNRDHVVVYVVRDFADLGGTPVADYEIAERGFFALDALPKGTSGATRRRLAEIAGEPISDMW